MRDHVKNAAVSLLVGATLVAGVIALAPGWGEDPPPAPGPAGRAMAAAGAGAPAAPADLAALIEDRERWLKDHPRDEESWAVLGTAYVQRGVRLAQSAQFPKAERALKKSLDVVPADEGNVEAMAGMAALANARRDFAGARGWGERAVKRKPKRWTTYPLLIEAYNGLGDYKAAGKAVDRMLELNSGPQARGVAALVYRDRGWREDAAATAHDAAANAEGPEQKAAALHRMGEFAWERGEPAEAIAHYDAALRARSDHHASLAGRARALAALGRTDEALRDYGAAQKGRPLPAYALEAGELYQSLGLDGDARLQYERLRDGVAEAAKHGVDSTLLLGRYEADHGSAEAAVRRLQAQWDKGRRSVGMADALGWALHRAGRSQQALEFARKAMDKGRRSALFSYHRGEIERSLGRYGAARRHLEEAVRTNPDFSPMWAPKAREALEAIGEPPEGAPRELERPAGTPAPTPSASASASASASGAAPTATPAPRSPSPSPSPTASGSPAGR
ncbi:tetratricopeptide repeat protein [Streptomyces sp. MUM 178J]|uniref:tetratricopeptide repeat protein n=1 Tax=Streptomyces sp. MUM 178J TaxID=2791991 RepID=UPI001F0462DC|nr:tetratricopeptide repeat protein [Streptomyces sp. MUM 178J]WRQ79623.1 hypothetical protein I3F59_009780 [Streptomyces sp. MUM 178J]